MSEANMLNQVTDRVGDLPAMPGIVAEVLKLTQDPATAISQLSEVIEKDPGLTAKILRVSNSPYFGMRQYVGTLKLALVILGVREVRNIVLGVAVFDAVQNENTTRLLAKDYWRHSFLVAGLAKMIGSEMQLGLQGEDFISGLLHDIGKMVLMAKLGDPYAAVYKKGGGYGERFYALEMQELGFTHADAGAAIGTKWNFPETLTDAIWVHHPCESRALANVKDPRLAAIVRVANAAARWDFEGGDADAFWEQADGEAWQYVEEACGIGDRVARYETLANQVAELRELPVPTFE